jgi:ABC-2 type transport system permease protein
MTLIATERIKLFTTRSPWWSMLLAVALAVGFSTLFAANAPAHDQLNLADVESGYQFGLIVMTVMAALAVTTEYRFSTIRTSFQAVPNRTALLLAKTAVVAALAAVIGEVTAFASWAMARAIHPTGHLALSGAAAWRDVAGMGLVYAITAMIAVAVGILIRQTAGAVAALLVYALLVENLVRIIPKVGQKIHNWMPFNVADHFLTSGNLGADNPASPMPLGPWASLLYFAGVGVVLLTIALVTANRRDA